MSVRENESSASRLVTEGERVKSCPAIPEFSVNWTTNQGAFFPQCLLCFLCTVIVGEELKLTLICSGICSTRSSAGVHQHHMEMHRFILVEELSLYVAM